ncbi:hypothetical protein L873DRAFT_1153568 [Choiromyces venosus 120613-1]|uniref:Uncharacterized protein n=1 Tax=Choiromyces venosus 120613-1 TaxID=1336337 RepID=A0A3N4JFX6_9PEZI|nr:hypothetical protein L873DRAFT_1153568 [Choiromyces venosus 120613-1]
MDLMEDSSLLSWSKSWKFFLSNQRIECRKHLHSQSSPTHSVLCYFSCFLIKLPLLFLLLLLPFHPLLSLLSSLPTPWKPCLPYSLHFYFYTLLPPSTSLLFFPLFPFHPPILSLPSIVDGLIVSDNLLTDFLRRIVIICFASASHFVITS